MNSKNTATYDNKLSPIALTRILTDRNLVKLDQKGYNESDIFFDFNESEKLDNYFKILTIGSNDINNPYFGGFFLFTGKFPDQYPFFPPHILAKTQGKNTRFHPNYYTNGKCCLSILGTWSGPPWTSCQNLGTTSQALKSLFIDNPITQEPGFENCKDQRSINYSKVIEYRTLEIAVISILNNPTKEFISFLPIIEKKFIELYPKYMEKLNMLRKFNKMKLSSPVYNVSHSMDIVYDIDDLEENFKKIYDNLISKYSLIENLETPLTTINKNSETTSQLTSSISNNQNLNSEITSQLSSSTSSVDKNNLKNNKCYKIIISI